MSENGENFNINVDLENHSEKQDNELSKIDNLNELNEFSTSFTENNLDLNEVNMKQKMILIEELKQIFLNKIKTLEEKIKESENEKKELNEKKKEYENRIREYEEKINITEQKKEEFIEKSKELEIKKEEYQKSIEKLEKTREQFKELSKKLEEKKIILEEQEKRLFQLEKDLEIKKINIEKEQKQLDQLKIEIEKKVKKYSLYNRIRLKEPKLDSEYFDNIDFILNKLRDDTEKKKKKGRIELIGDTLKELLEVGHFQSCFLIDGKGMIISDCMNEKQDAIAIGAMFSLIWTSLLRTINSLNLRKLEYFKMSSLGGQFLLKNIDVNNYERNLILLAYYDDSNKEKIERENIIFKKRNLKKALKNFLKQEEFYKKSNVNVQLIDNLIENLNFLKNKLFFYNGDFDKVRIDSLNKIAIKIKEIFEK
ncbi:MAG: hypothetical protein ACTSVV_05225 [Promethearchaeota archaeon]